ncbi:hypothetical protein TNCV_2880681 [Trichonephila clavipes]|nr:hypothetical protein TNCV_2880681 [Trichonephila clavipes]
MGEAATHVWRCGRAGLVEEGVRQQAWEDNLSTLNAEDNSLGNCESFQGRKPPDFRPLMALLIKIRLWPNLREPISLLPVLSKLAESDFSQTQRPSRKRKYPDSGAARVPTSSLHLTSTSQSR